MSDPLEKLRKRENFFAEEGADITAVVKMEEQLGVVFPDQYRMFLLKNAFVETFGRVILGVCEGDLDTDAVLQTQYARGRQILTTFSPFPNNCVVVARYSLGGFYVLFCVGHEREGEVWLLDDHENGREVAGWPTFHDFLMDDNA